MTKDERLLIELYKAAIAAGGPEEGVDPHPIAKKLGYKEVMLAQIIKGLCKANFIIAHGHNEVVLTRNGLSLVHTLLPS